MIQNMSSLTTLFSPDIVTPLLKTVPHTEPPERRPSSTPIQTINCSDISNQVSLKSYSWLTNDLQKPSQEDLEASYTHGQHQGPLAGSRGNPRLLFMGLRRYSESKFCNETMFKLTLIEYRCGKSSVQKVVFQKLPPADTLYLESTNKIETASMQYVHCYCSRIQPY